MTPEHIKALIFFIEYTRPMPMAAVKRLTEEQAQELVTAWRNAYPGIASLLHNRP